MNLFSRHQESKQYFLTWCLLLSYVRLKHPATLPVESPLRTASAPVFVTGAVNKDILTTLLSEPWHILSKINLKRPTTGPICWNSAAL